MARAVRPSLALLTLVVAVLTGASAASAYWTSAGSGSAAAATAILAAPVDVTVPATAPGAVAVSWTHPGGVVEPTGFFLTRESGGTVTSACGTSPAALTDDTGCTDSAVPIGTYTYTVTAVYRSWTARSVPSPSVAVTAPPLLGDAASYSVLAGTAIVNTGSSTTISGDVGVSPGTAVTGLGAEMVGGTVHVNDAHAASAQSALASADTELRARPAGAEIVGDLGGRTLTPGVYHSTAALAVTGELILDAEGDTAATFVFQVDAAFNTAAASHVTLINGAQASNVFWVVLGAAGTGADSFLSGSILAQGAITLGAGTELIGRALSRTAVTLASNVIRFTTELPPSLTIDGGAIAVTKDTTPTISGTTSAPPSSPVAVTISGSTVSTVVGAGGTWSVVAPAFPAGTYDVVAKVRDPAGNGSVATQALTIEVNPIAPALGSAATFSVLAGTAIVNTGATEASGDVGVSPGTSVTGFPPGTHAGSLHAGDPVAAAAQNDLLAALTEASALAPHTQIVGDLGGRTFHAGVHHAAAALALTGTLTLDGEGDSDAVFIFQTDAAFNTAADSTVVLTGGAQASNVFWVVTGAAGTGATSTISGAVLARGAITLGAGTRLSGQALSRDAVTLAAGTLTGIDPAPLARRAPPAQAEEPGPSTDPSPSPSTDPSDSPSPSPPSSPSPSPSPVTP
ncbi:ice-binding family protein [Microbacterium sp. P05]|uniref:ice-binding family protein n=1 Tax=Microbacterium sp. P05 TaxID=3366948 RepID=UPI0037467F3B